jgi:enoyl-CoA hydratase
MTYQTLLYEKADVVATVTLNRPDKLNALNSTVYNELYAAFEAAESDPEVGAIILTGSGERSFAAGSDIVEMQHMGPLESQRFMATIRRASDFIYNLTKPTVAAVNGYALGGGCELSLCCDLRIASDRARFGQPEVTLGLIPGAGGTQRLTRVVGPAKAKEMIYLGEMIKADEALRIGLVNRVVPAESLMEEARAVAAKLAGFSTPVIEMAKMAINTAVETDLASGLSIETKCNAICFSLEDRQEGMDAFMEKRPAVFKNK